MSRVEVLLATRDSAAYLRPLLDSLVAQSHDDFTLVVGDDVSRDETPAIIEEMAPRFRRAPVVRRRDRPSGSASANFSALLADCDADYALLADHDDVWAPDKIERALERIRAVEARVGADVPVLVHGDLKVVDAALNPIAASYWRFKSISPGHGVRLNTALMHATVTGCTAAMNRALLRRLKPTPPEAIMHDWWINLTAAAFGAVDYDPELRILYRVHGANVSQPRRVSALAMLSRLDKATGARRAIRRRVEQAQAFLDAYGPELPPAARDVVENFAGIGAAGPLGRRLRLWRGGHFFPKPWRNVAAFPSV